MSVSTPVPSDPATLSGADEAPILGPAVAVDPVALAQLWAGQFQHLTTIGIAGAGGVLILLQAQLFPADERWWLALALFAVTSMLSMYGQIAVVDAATEARAPGKKPRTLRALALAFLGAAAGSVLATLMR